MVVVLLAGIHMPSAAGAATEGDAVRLVVANRMSLPDMGIAASLVAGGVGDAVVFAQARDALGEESVEILESVQPAHVLIVGGTAVLGNEVTAEIRNHAPDTAIERLAGADRMHTAELAARRVLQARLADAPAVVVLANGWSLPDVAVASSAVATGRADAVLYAGRTALGSSPRSVLADYRPTRLIFVGGTAALTSQIETDARSAAGRDAATVRVGGPTRVETASLFAAQAFAAGADSAVIVDGWDADAVGLAAALAAASDGAAVLYAQGSRLDGQSAELLSTHVPERVQVVAPGSSADDVSDRVETLLPDATLTVTTSHAAAAAHLELCPNGTDADDDPGGAAGGGGGGGTGGGGGGSASTIDTTTRLPLVYPPTSLSVTPGDERLELSWGPPAGVTSDLFVYRLRWKGPGQAYSDTERWRSTAEQRYEISGLTNGSTYHVQVLARWAPEGSGEWTEVSGVPREAPEVPRSVRLTAGDESIGVTWRAPGWDGGEQVSSYSVRWLSRLTELGVTEVTGLSHRVDGLVNGVEYAIQVAAANSAGPGEWSAPVTAIPRGTPEAPLGVNVRRGDRSAHVSWLPPVDDGASAVTGYRVQWRADGQAFSPVRQRAASREATGVWIRGLSNGVVYFTRVIAGNAIGYGTPSAAFPVTPATIPSQPDAPTVSFGDRSLNVSWRAPYGGGIAISRYLVQWRADHESFSSGSRQAELTDPTDLTHEISGLDNGTEQHVRIAAVNQVGLGPWSTPASGTPATHPDAPQIGTLSIGNGAITASWHRPDDGGTRIVRYEVQYRPADARFLTGDPMVSAEPRHLSRRISTLTNGTEYFVRVRAVNAAGAGPWSTPASAVPLAIEGPPRNVRAVAAQAAVTVAWQAPAGSASLSGYKVQWRSGDQAYDPASRQLSHGASETESQVTGLSNGTTYYVRVIAVNPFGDGEPSAEADATPATVPGTPIGLRLERADQSVTAIWAPGDDGGSVITRYRIRWRAGDDHFTTADTGRIAGSSPYRIGSLTNGTEYFVQVKAENAVGTSGWSSSASAVAADTPSAPRSLVIERGDRKLGVAWQAPADSGGIAATGYLVQWRADGEMYDAGSRQATVSDLTDLSHEIGSLANGTTYFVRVLAVNGAGTGEPTAEKSGVPATLPAAPSGLALETRDRAVRASWSTPDNGGSAVSLFVVQWRTDGQLFDEPERQATVAGTSHVITGLDNGTEYFVRVSAVNAVGWGGWSGAASAFAAVPPDPPGSLEITPGDGWLTARWAAPAADGGAAISGYVVQWRTDGQQFDAANRQATVPGTSHVITGLDNGTEYWLSVRARNAAGDGAAALTSETPYTLPGQPPVPAVIASATALQLSWSAGSDGGSAITSYRVQWKSSGEEYNTTTRQSNPTFPSVQLADLTEGTEYTIRIAAVNAAGEGPAREVTATPWPPPNPPLSSEVTVLNRSFVVTWAPPTDSPGPPIERYRVMWRTDDQPFNDSPCSHRAISVKASDDLHAVIGTLTNGTAYAVRIVSVNEVGASGPLDFTATPVATPSMPLRLGAFSVSGGIRLRWYQPPDNGSTITGYRVQWKAPGEDYSTTERFADIDGASTTDYEIDGLTDGTSYTVRLAAKNANGFSRYATASAAPGDAPGAPGDLTVGATQGKEFRDWCLVTFSWTAPTDEGGSPILGYRIQVRRLVLEDFSTHRHWDATVESTERSFSYEYAPPRVYVCNTSFGMFVRVTPFNAAGNGLPIETEF